MATATKEWLERPTRPRPEVSYLRKSTKGVRCRNEIAHACVSPTDRVFVHSHWHTIQHPLRWVATTRPEEDVVSMRDFFGAAAPAANVEVRFHKLATEWLKAVGSVSSVEALTSHPKYREIVRLGWDVVPFLLADLQQGRGFWFTALNEITGIRPFDPSDAGKSKRMTEAWIIWGKRKGII